jgi:hypothetical protein
MKLITPSSSGYLLAKMAVKKRTVIDEGPENSLDLVELTPADPDESPVVDEFGTIEEALAFAAATYGALPHKYVTESMVNEEYADYLKGLGIEGK